MRQRSPIMSPSPPPPAPAASSSPSLRNAIPPLFFIAVFLSLLFLLVLRPSYTSPTTDTTTAYQSPFIPPRGAASPFTLILKVLTYNRISSFTRCLNSLALAHYDDFTTVHLHIHIDHFPLENNDRGSLEWDSKLNLSRQILDFLDTFRWDFGQKVVHYRSRNVGLQAQWIEAWWPSSDHEFAFVVEDDLELSPLYFRFLKALILNYYYNQSNYSPFVYGASLQRPRFVPGKHGNKIQLDDGTQLFLYQLVGTWGQLLFPRPWKEFRLWYDNNKAKGIKPIIDGMVTTGWYKRMGERIWTPWFIKFIHARGYFNIYTNFKNETALSVSHRDAGVNYGKSAGPDSYFVDENSYSHILQMQPLSGLKWYDFCFREVIPNRTIKSFDQLGSSIHSNQKSKTAVLVDLQGASQMSVRNLLCHFERLGVDNYFFMGQKSDLFLDLARRGHPVIDLDQFSLDGKLYKSMKIQDSGKEWLKHVIVHASVIRKLLELNLNMLALDSNMVPISDDLPFNSTDSNNDICVGKNLKLFFIRRSPASLKIWDDSFLKEVAAVKEDLMKKSSGPLFNLVQAVGRILEQKGIKYEKIDEMQIGLHIDSNQSNLENGKRFAFWSSDTDPEIVQKKLIDLDVWAVDGEFSCKAVACHQS